MTGGATAADERIASWVWQQDHLRRYKQTRNGLLGADFSSRFSPWLANGSISPRSIAETIRDYETERVANEDTYWLLFELLWRDYFNSSLGSIRRIILAAGDGSRTRGEPGTATGRPALA